MSRNHLASCGSIGFSGRRVGTTFAHTPRAVLGLLGEPWFRFRNDECERICREAWMLPPPASGEYFEVADEGQAPEYGWSTRIDGELQKCSLVRWESEPFSGARLHRLGETEFYRCLQERPDYFWYPVGRLLKINEAGTALLAPEQRKDAA